MPNRSLYGAAQIARPIITFLPMNTENKTVLLITTDQPYMAIIRKVFADTIIDPFDFEWAGNFPDGIKRLNEGGIDAVLLDLSLANGDGIDTIDTLHPAAPQIPVLVLGGADDEDLARQAVQHGADDYLLKDYVNGHTLPRALRNAIARRAFEDELFVERERAEVTLNSIGDAVLSTDNSGNVTYLNPVAEKMTGWTHAQASGRPITDVFRIIDGTTRAIGRNPVEVAIKQNKVLKLASDCVLVRRDGVEIAIEDSTAPIHDRTGQVTGAVIVFHDVSESREVKIKMAHLARHDPLTDLPNRTLLNERIHHAIALACRHKKQFAVLFLDVDRFKDINDSLGHPIGDRLLRSVAERLLACVRNTDTVSRLGGDEFVVLLPDVSDTATALNIGNKLVNAMNAPAALPGRVTQLRLSVGVALSLKESDSVVDLIHRADTAMYQAKQAGGARAYLFSAALSARTAVIASIEDDLRLAIESNSLTVHFQPQVLLTQNVLCGVEALVRWTHPTMGMIAPNQFIPIAERCGLIHLVGRLVLDQTLALVASLDAEGTHLRRVSVNVSAIELRPGFAEGVEVALAHHKIAPHRLDLEITESTLVNDGISPIDVLSSLRKLGVTISVDDFGVGYSSLSQLRRLPIDSLKIDRSFVAEICSNAQDRAIVTAVVTMARSLDLRTVAEGAESKEQLAMLKALGCDCVQGYVVARPLPALALKAWVRDFELSQRG